jgi:Tfp pilus assembly protein PilN
MKIRLNVATRPFESHRRFIAGAAVVGAVGLVVLVLLSISVLSTWRRNSGERARIAAYENQLAQMHGRQQALHSFFTSPKTKTVIDRAAFLNTLIDQRSFPWTKIFTDLEKVLPAGVRVLSIAPKMEKGQVDVKLVVGATSDKSKLIFLDRLQKSPAFSNIRVSAYTQKTSSTGKDEVDVQLEAVYSGAAGAQE